MIADVAWLSPLFAGAAVVWLRRSAGSPMRAAIGTGLVALALTAVALLAIYVVAWNECLAENRQPPPPLSWPWSPRRQFCNDADSLAARGVLAILALPALLVLAGALLRERGRRMLGAASYALLVAVPFLPSLYVRTLPYYGLYSTPILQQPLLRPASAKRPARVCYAYGLYEQAQGDLRLCLELAPTPEATRLTAAYDEGRSIYDLDWLGKNITARGMPIGARTSGVRGLEVRRAYILPDARARAGATLVR